MRNNNFFRNLFKEKYVITECISDSTAKMQNIPTSFRLPAEIQNYYEMLAKHTRVSLQNTIVQTLAGVMEGSLSEKEDLKIRKTVVQKDCLNKCREEVKMVDSTINHSIAIFGNVGNGKTIFLNNEHLAIQSREKAKTIFINCHNSLLVNGFEGVIKNKILINDNYDKSPVDIELLETQWQDLVFNISPNQIAAKAIDSLCKNVIQFVDRSDIPCVIIIDDLHMFAEESRRYLIQLSNYVTRKNGYFLFSFDNPDCEQLKIHLNKVDKAIVLDTSGKGHTLQCAQKFASLMN